MGSEQQERFAQMHQLWSAAHAALTDMHEILDEDLRMIDHDSSRQAAALQRVQERAGTAVQALQQVFELARHARSYQAQRHQEHTGNVPH
ncbi:MAG: hypothetical protein K6T63_01530 [Alicyclobacillus herbarius]|uniref:hypothetical protein n=1 Tax=Alicyclobacillus herbarius TaxID=122960 RepID=UPI002353FCD9|nr:hypothetical protein [Alicyclobacillus herbarius]MCL6631289.1 hypothetical protein [Alicyclobacillus herbarius]